MRDAYGLDASKMRFLFVSSDRSQKLASAGSATAVSSSRTQQAAIDEPYSAAPDASTPNRPSAFCHESRGPLQVSSATSAF